ncbi:MAG: OB-fold nucleic acid binding domain-containing protein, partial [Syntrophales bacterium]
MSEELSDLLKVRRDKLQNIRDKGVNPYPYKFTATAHSNQVLEKFSQLTEGQESPETVAIAGRIMTKRGHGKASFATIQDEFGRVQIYAKLDVMGEPQYELWQNLDMGDYVGVTGHVFRTKTNEITVRVE